MNNPCFNCGYYWADLDDEGRPITNEYCHFVGPEEWAPCYTEEPDEPEDYPEYDYIVDAEEEVLVEYFVEYGAPYDYQEF